HYVTRYRALNPSQGHMRLVEKALASNRKRTDLDALADSLETSSVERAGATMRLWNDSSEVARHLFEVARRRAAEGSAEQHLAELYLLPSWMRRGHLRDAVDLVGPRAHENTIHYAYLVRSGVIPQQQAARDYDEVRARGTATQVVAALAWWSAQRDTATLA